MSQNFSIRLTSKLDTTNVKKDIKNLNQSLSKQPLKLKLELSKTDKSYLKTINQMINANKTIKLSFKEVSNAQKETSESFKKSSASMSSYNKEVNNVANRMQQFINLNENAYSAEVIDRVKQLQTEVRQLYDVGDISKLKELKETLNAISIGQKTGRTSTIVNEKDLKTLQSMVGRMDSLKVSKDKAFKRNPALEISLDKIQQEAREALDTITAGGKKSQKEISGLSARFKDLSQQINTTQQKTMTFKEQLSEATKKFGMWSGVTTMYFQAIRGIKEMITSVIELDTSLTELRKVTNLSEEQIVKFTEKAYSAGTEIGRTGKEVVDATQKFAQAGYEINKAFDLSQVALTMMNVGDGIEDVDTASQTLISTLKGFNMESKDAISIVDKLNKVSNTSAISYSDLAEGMTRVSAVMNQADVSIEQTTGLLTG